MSNFDDIEHDSIADAPEIVGQAKPPAPERTDRQLDRDDMREARADKRKRDAVNEPIGREAMLAQRYGVRKVDPKTEAAQDHWLSLDNDELFTPLRMPR